MEEKRELNLDELNKVSGGTDGGLYDNMKFYEMDAESQRCATDGYCPRCNPQRQGDAWNKFKHDNYGYHCYKCRFDIAKV